MKHNQNHDNAPNAGPQLVPVRFEDARPTAITVGSARCFNHGQPTAKSVHPSKAGHCARDTSLASASHEYCLVVDSLWIPYWVVRTPVPKPFGGRDLILKVARSPEAADLMDTENLPLKNANQQNPRKL